MKRKWEYYKRLAALYHAYLRRNLIVPVPPLRLWLEISSRCNLRCTFCPNKDLPPGQKGDMAWPLFRALIDQARHFALEINLHHRGETLLHPEAGRFIRYATETEIPCRLHTNATLLQGQIADEILDSGLQQISVSFDGFSADVYEANRVGASFAQVTGNISRFLEKRRHRLKKTPRLTIEVMELPGIDDPAKRRRFQTHLAKLGLDEMVFKKPHNWAGYLKNPSGNGPVSACTFPWSALVVLFDGRVTPCPQDFFAGITLGHAGHQPLLDIWNSPAIQELRAAFASSRLDSFPVCADCDRIRRRTLGGIPVEYLKRLIFRRMT